VDGASALTFSFVGTGGFGAVLYDLRLIGHAVVSERVYAPTEPPRDPQGGVLVDPADFSPPCVATTEPRLVGASTIAGWALFSFNCVEPTMKLAARHYPGHTFYARVGIGLGDVPTAVNTVRFVVLDRSGKVVRSTTITTRYGFGWQPVRVSVSGGSALRITFAGSGYTFVYAMSTS
jgi:hypothetical protein